ncbi:ribosome biosynthesis protein [Tritrichomonas musculus]|uniref:Ribosome biosynthesis protein n=1 Tax=Tritrichomonas musculus TaxID=1915356 RepID=A0ABR2JPZ7_9EUKA
MRIMKQAPKVKDLPIKNKQEKRNKAREERALSVAHVEYTVKEELKNRLKNGVYGEIYNLDAKEFNEALDEIAEPVEFIDESELEEEVFEYDDEEEEKAELAHA